MSPDDSVRPEAQLALQPRDDSWRHPQVEQAIVTKSTFAGADAWSHHPRPVDGAERIDLLAEGLLGIHRVEDLRALSWVLFDEVLGSTDGTMNEFRAESI